MLDRLTTIGNEYYVATTIFAVTVILALIVQIVLKLVKRWIGSRSETPEADPKYLILEAIDGPAVLLLFIAVGTLMASVALVRWQTAQDLEADLQADLSLAAQRIGIVAFVFTAAFLTSRISRLLLNWYMSVVAPRTPTQLDKLLIPSLERVITILLYALAVLWCLSVYEISISPLLATLGVVGIAIALAIQPTLSNYFAGTTLTSEGELHVGDYVEIEEGPSGVVEDISWRSTKLRTTSNDLVIVPNAIMSENIVTKLAKPADAEKGEAESCQVRFEYSPSRRASRARSDPLRRQLRSRR